MLCTHSSSAFRSSRVAIACGRGRASVVEGGSRQAYGMASGMGELLLVAVSRASCESASSRVGMNERRRAQLSVSGVLCAH